MSASATQGGHKKLQDENIYGLPIRATIKQHMHKNTTERTRLVTIVTTEKFLDMFGDPPRSVMEVSGWELVLARKGDTMVLSRYFVGTP